MIAGIAIGAAVVLLLLFAISIRRRLAVMDENINNAMNQIGVQLCLCFNAIGGLLEETRGYAPNESRMIMDAVRSRRSTVTGKSTPDQVIKQEQVISEALNRISVMAEKYPEIKAGQTYISTMKAVDSYQKTAGTGRLIYNDSVAKLNRQLHMFPTWLLGGMMGFRKREYLEAAPKPAERY